MAMMDYYVADAERTLARLQSHVAKSRRAAEALSEVKNRQSRGTQLNIPGVGGVARQDTFGVQSAEKYGPAPQPAGSWLPKRNRTRSHRGRLTGVRDCATTGARSRNGWRSWKRT